ncbi:MAG TPA: hypothetical protein DET40_08155 [Lentisphaeria bacterium]|nr:MAG: hypothetical protein A2X45_10360 [Lentisphaerae bacterium GWF2_50_93]HCE43505.1 hypothetical protein [Lentisphaeria bacterium]
MRKALSLLIVFALCTAINAADPTPKTFACNGWSVSLGSGISLSRSNVNYGAWFNGITLGEWKKLSDTDYEAAGSVNGGGKDLKDISFHATLSPSGNLKVSLAPAAGAAPRQVMMICQIDETLGGTSVEMDGEAVIIPVKGKDHEFKHARSFEFFKSTPFKRLKISAPVCEFANLRDFRALRNTGPFELFIIGEKDGRLEVNFDLSLAVAKQGGTEFGARPGGTDPVIPGPASGKNLIQNPGFENGLASWCLDVNPDTGISGWKIIDSAALTGKRSAEFTTVKGVGLPMLSSFPFPTVQDKEYTISFNTKTDRPGTEMSLFMQTTNWGTFPLIKRVKMEGDWKKFVFTFKAANPFARICFGDLWYEKGSVDGAKIMIDDVQVEPGTSATDFVQKPVACRLETDEKYNVFFTGSAAPARIVLTNTGATDADCGTVVKITDVNHKVLVTKTFEARLAPWEAKPFALDLSTSGIRGFIRVEMEAKAGGFAEVFHGRATVCEPVDRKPALIYAYHCEEGPDVKDLPWLKKLGYRGTLAFRPPEKPSVMGEYDKADWRHIFTVVEGEKCPVKVFKQEMTEADWNKYFEWLDKRIEPFLGMPIWWKTMNEPNCGGYKWTPEDNLKVVRHIREKVMSANPKALILTPDPYSSDRNAQNWLDSFLTAGGKEVVNALATHTYRGRPEAPDLDLDIQALKAIKARHGLGKAPIMFTEGEATAIHTVPEIGMSPFRGFFEWRLGLLSLDAGVSEASAAALMARTLLVCLKNSDEVKCYLTWADGDFASGQPLASLGSVNQAMSLLGDARFLGEHVIGNNTRTYVFETASKNAVAAVWCCDIKVERGEIPAPKAIIPLPASGWKLIDMMGNPQAFERKDGAISFDLSNQPTYIVCDTLGAAELNKALEHSTYGAEGLRMADLNVRVTAADAAAVNIINRLTGKLAGVVSVTVDGKNVAEKELSLESKEAKSVAFALSGFKQGAFNKAKVSVVFKESATGAVTTFEDKDFVWFAIPPAQREPSIEGDLADWLAMETFILEKKESVTNVLKGVEWKGPSDFSAAYHLGYGKGGLYFCAEVDDENFLPATTIPSAWQGDSLQLYIDLNADGHDRPDVGYDSNDESIWAAKIASRDILFRDYVPEWQVAFVRGGMLEKGKVSIRRNGNKTIYMIHLPPEEIFPLKMKPGTSFGFGIIANDSDKEGGGRRLSITNTKPDTEPHQRPEIWPIAVLIDK